MKAWDMFLRLAMTLFVIMAVVAIFMLVNDKDSLTKNVEVFYFFGGAILIFIALAMISGIWEGPYEE